MAWFKSDKRDEKQPAADLTSAAPFVTQYGAWCRTRAFQASEMLEPTYWEAYQQDGATDKWTVDEVGFREKDGERIRTSRTLHRNLPFQAALHYLASFECGHAVLPGEPVGESAEELGDAHYRLFGEREGFIFDTSGAPHMPPGPHATGPGTFRESDVARARENAKSAQELERINQPRGPLAEVFNSISHVGNYDEVLSGLEQIGHFDAFCEHIDEFRRHLSGAVHNPVRFDETSYRKYKTTLNPRDRKMVKYTESDYMDSYTVKKHQLTSFDKATIALDQAYEELMAAKDKGANTDNLLTMLHKFDAVAHLLNAQALFHKACTTKGDNDEVTAKIRDMEKRATDICKNRLGITGADELAALKQAVIQGERAKVPDFIQEFGSDYIVARGKLARQKEDGRFNPKKLRRALGAGGVGAV